MSQNLSSALVVIDALRVNSYAHTSIRGTTLGFNPNIGVIHIVHSCTFHAPCMTISVEGV